MLAQLCAIYGWTPQYILDELTIQEVFLYWDYGLEFEEYRAMLLVAKVGQAMDGKVEPLRKERNSKPDKKKFYDRYGKQIKRPGGEV
jgi:hypothetical protein